MEEAESFYYAYAKVMGFGVRQNYKRLSTITPGKITSLRLVCSAQGQRDVERMTNKKRVRRQKKETRFNCPCLFKVRYLNNIDAYVVVGFITHHTHPLAQAHKRCLLTPHRSVQDSHVALTTSMQRVYVKPCHTYEYIVNRSGGFQQVGFTIKDLYNKLDSKCREILLESDAEVALAYMRGIVFIDSVFELGDLIISRTFRFGSCCVYVSSSYNDEEPHNKYMTSYYQDKDNPRIECSCKLFECEGITCCHIFNVMKHERINKIFSSLVLKRWRKSAKVDMQTSFSIEFARYGDLNCFGSKLCYLASKTKEGTDILNKEFMRLEPILSDLLKQEKENENENTATPEKCTNIIKDPIKVKTKGTEKSPNIKKISTMQLVQGLWTHKDDMPTKKSSTE
ncbi:hypothetical protein ACLB2K_021000 [Fragaria x ananassa]